MTGPEPGLRWRWLLLVVCAIALGGWVASARDIFGAGSPPLFGFWDGLRNATNQPYHLVATVRPGGAWDRAGIRQGDQFDLRDNTLEARTQLLWQPIAGRAIPIVFRRDGKKHTTIVTPTSVYDGQPAWKLPSPLISRFAMLVLLGCAVLIAWRRTTPAEGRLLASIMLLWVLATVLSQNASALPDAHATLVQVVLTRALMVCALSFAVFLASHYGARSRWRFALEALAYTTGAIRLGVTFDTAVGAATFRPDPVPLWGGPFWTAFGDLNTILVALASFAAVATTDTAERRRAAWLLLPLPLAFAASGSLASASSTATSWFTFIAYIIAANCAILVGALFVTYALLRRRLLDLGFVFGRSVVVGGVSLIVVSAFVLLEWVLGTVLAGVSHTTSVAANAILALALGLSLRFIHQRVDGLVGAVMFRKRRAGERALLDFSREAAFVTKPDALLDRAIELVQNHTDAAAAALLLHEDDAFKSLRKFGELSEAVDENDPAILALKTWNRPIDPHGYETTLGGDLAIPMLSRGRLLGVLVCGERTTGEDYAPDEIATLVQFAQGVGSAYDVLGYTNGRSHDGELLTEIRSLRAALEKASASQKRR